MEYTCPVRPYRVKNLVHQQFGRLKVVRLLGLRPGNKHIFWECHCNCGQIKAVDGDALKSGRTVSCGCYFSEVNSEKYAALNFRHGKCYSKVYNSWQGIKGRCLNPNAENYADYGGRGVFMHSDWVADFTAFYSYMGDPPSPAHSIDRVDVNGHYVPGNVRWATPREQMSNRRNTLRVVYRGQSVVLKDLCREKGLNYHTVWGRINTRGYSVERAIEQPIKGA